MSRRVAFAVPGDLDAPTGGYGYDRRMIAELRELGWVVDALRLGDGFPFPCAGERKAARALLGAVAEGTPLLIDGLAFGAMANEAVELRQRHPLIALVHHPLALEIGLDSERASMLRRSEIAALHAAHRVVVTSAPTAELLAADYDVARERIVVVRPGCDAVARPARPEADDAPVQLLAVGTLAPRKGHDRLIAALAQLTDLPWRLMLVGDRGRDPVHVAAIDYLIASSGLASRVVQHGAVSQARLAQFYAAADLFVLASHYEGYGMVFAEAVAHGLPVVATDVGAAAELVREGAGLLVAPDDGDALVAALRLAIGNPQMRRNMAERASIAAATLPTWRDGAQLLAQTIEAAQ